MKFKLGFTIIEMLICIFLFCSFITLCTTLSTKLSNSLKHSVNQEICINEQLSFFSFKLQLIGKKTEIVYSKAEESCIINAENTQIELKKQQKIKINQMNYDILCKDVIIDNNLLIIKIVINNQEYPCFIRGEVNEMYHD